MCHERWQQRKRFVIAGAHACDNRGAAMTRQLPDSACTQESVLLPALGSNGLTRTTTCTRSRPVGSTACKRQHAQSWQ